MSEKPLTRAHAVETAKRALPGFAVAEIDNAVVSLFVDAIQNGKPVDEGDALDVIRMAWRERLLSHGDMMLASLFVVFDSRD